MNVEFKSSFARDLRKVKDEEIRIRVQRLIALAEEMGAPEMIPGIKKLRAQGNYFRIRIGEYRVGIIISGDMITFG